MAKLTDSLKRQLSSPSFTLKAIGKAFYSNGFLLLCACYFILKKPNHNSTFRVTSTLGTKVIFEAYVSPDTQVIVPVWIGSWPNQTQTVAYTQWKDLPKYKQKSLDIWGWVW